MHKKIVFITGGARSGKSSFAVAEASRINGKKACIATAEALDEEMRQRIENHRRQRGDEWVTYEEPIKIANVIKKIEGEYSVIVIDCLTLWLSNIMHSGLEITDAINTLIDVLNEKNPPSPPFSKGGLGGFSGEIESERAGASHAPTLFVVSNEVGMGIVPENEMARKFRDMAGILNQKMAEVSDRVYMVVAGIPIKIKDKGEA
jgi:adenosylcobinamide kinase/adenosylcobinamide-phosphate guanylyltransferase